MVADLGTRRGSAFTARQWMFVEDLLAEGWSPEQTSGRLRRDGILRISYETIYKYVWAEKHAGGSLASVPAASNEEVSEAV